MEENILITNIHYVFITHIQKPGHMRKIVLINQNIAEQAIHAMKWMMKDMLFLVETKSFTIQVELNYILNYI